MLTQKRDLKSGLPVWLVKRPLKLKIETSLGRTSTDVLVVGTGISGALVADALMQAGYSVLALDRREPMSGSTPASTTLLQFELDTSLVELSRKIGKSDAPAPGGGLPRRFTHCGSGLKPCRFPAGLERDRQSTCPAMSLGLIS